MSIADAAMAWGGGAGGGVVDVLGDATGGGAEAVLVATSVEGVSRLHACQAKTAPIPTTRTAPATAGMSQGRDGAVLIGSAGELVAVFGVGRCCTGADSVGATAETPEDSERFWSASARAKSVQRGNRSFGSFANATARTGSRAASSGRVSASTGGAALRCWLITTAGLECGNNCEPVSRC